MTSTYEIRRSLAEIFDIPFQVEIHRGPEPGYVIRPDMVEKYFFDIAIEFRNHVRMVMNFVPQQYSVPFVKNMGQKTMECKLKFAEYSKCLQNEGCIVDFHINNHSIKSSSPEEWPDESWDRIQLKVTKAPFEINDEEDYGDLVLRYGHLMLGMILSLSDIVPLEETTTGYKEGAEQRILSKRYERNRLNRELCLLNKGYKCAVCGFDFEESYGIIGRHFIHVHHVIPVSQIGANYIIDPVKDLIPVCPNCHAMLHRKDPPFLPEEMKTIVEKERNKSNE